MHYSDICFEVHEITTDAILYFITILKVLISTAADIIFDFVFFF